MIEDCTSGGANVSELHMERRQDLHQSDLVKAIDPLYANTALTKFPDDAKAHEYKEILLPWPSPMRIERTVGRPFRHAGLG